jgi:hypothetical protein
LIYEESALVVAQAFGTQAEAEFAKGALESAGIDSMVQADAAGGMRPHLAWSGLGFRVLVREEDVAAAREVLSPPDAGELVLFQTYATQDEADTALGALLPAGMLLQSRMTVLALGGLKWLGAIQAFECWCPKKMPLKRVTC